MTEYVLRHPNLTGDFSEAVGAESPENAIKAVHSDEWVDLYGETEVYEAEDVPNPEEFMREQFPVGNADAVLVVDVKPVPETREFERIRGEREGEYGRFKIEQ